ncbi:MAG TPA: hypothetical protein VFZ66_10595 [Herpetosiphonaceae bacterium]
MSNWQQVGDLQIEQDLQYQQRMWTVERIGWLLLLLGGGPLSMATAGDQGAPLQAQYGRFVRHGGQAQLEIRLQPGAAQGTEARVWIDRAYLDGIRIEHITPEPESIEAASDRMIYVFKLSQPGQPTSLNVQYHA